MSELGPLHVKVDFGRDIPHEVQGPALLAFERNLRQLTDNALWIEVFKDTKGDDSKLRTLMTPDQRKNL